MIKPNKITIGSFLCTNRGEIIKVDSIGTKRQHRKVSYHRDGEPTKIRYVRLAQCHGIPLSDELLKVLGFEWDEESSQWWLSDFCLTSGYTQLIGGTMWKEFKFLHELMYELEYLDIKTNQSTLYNYLTNKYYMTGIFKNAYFNKLYITRDGRKATFIIKMEGHYNFPYRLVIEGQDNFTNYNEYGRTYCQELPNDIVGEFDSSIETK